MIELKNICFRRGKKSVLNRISFILKPGEIGGVIGESGAGKTSLLNIIAGLESPSEGQIISQNEDITNLAPYLRDMGLVFQEWALFPNMTLAQNIGFGIKDWAKKKAHDRIHECAKRLDIFDLLSRYPSQLSGGEQQRAAIARSLAPKPRVLLLDEPFACVDPKNREGFSQYIQEIARQESVIVLMVSHNIPETMALCDQMGVLSEGTLLQWAPPQTLYQFPTNPTIAELLGPAYFIPIHQLDPDIEMSNKVVLIRPENIQLSSSGRFEGTIRSIRQIAGQTRVILNWKGMILTHQYSQQDGDVDEGKTVTFDMDWKNAPCFEL